MHKENSRCNYCGRILYKNVSNKYIVCSEKCKSLIKKTDKLKSVDSTVFGLIDYKWNKVEDLFQKVQIDKFEFISSVRRRFSSCTFSISLRCALICVSFRPITNGRASPTTS